MHIRVVIPLATASFDRETATEFSNYAASGVEVSVVHLDEGPASIESECEEAMAVPGLLLRAREAERSGCHAVIFNCFGDPGVHAARELVDIPVIGPGQAAMLVAAALGQRFSVVTVLPNVFPLIERVAWQAGVHPKLASIRSVDIPVLDLQNKQRMLSSLSEQMERAIREDEAHVLVLGCTGMMGVANQLHGMLAAAGMDVPIVDPVGASVKFAETLVGLGVRQSRLSYFRPKSSRALERSA